MTARLIMVRHGQSQWNLENRFTGWVDVELTAQGEQEAIAAGKAIKAEGFKIDKAFVSPLTRARKTAMLLRTNSEQNFDLTESPEIIERFYGGLTGLNKTETMEEYGEEKVHLWRRSYDVPPPPLEKSDDRHPENNPSYKKFPFKLPATESLKDVVDRVEPFYNNILIPNLQAGKTVLLAAHGNSIRALVKIIGNLNEEQIQAVEIPTGKPLLYVFDDALNLVEQRFLEAA